MGKMEAQGGLAAVKLTTTIRDIQRVEFLFSFAGLSARLAQTGKIGRPEARKEVVLSG